MPEQIEIKDEKSTKPPSKNYIAVFLVIAAVLAVFFLFSGVLTPGAYDQVGRVDTPTEALNTETTLNTDVQEITTDMEDIGSVLGV